MTYKNIPLAKESDTTTSDFSRSKPHIIWIVKFGFSPFLCTHKNAYLSEQSNWFWKLFDSKSSITMTIACICCETIKSSSYICARKNYPINFCSILSLYFKISFSSSTKYQILLCVVKGILQFYLNGRYIFTVKQLLLSCHKNTWSTRFNRCNFGLYYLFGKLPLSFLFLTLSWYFHPVLKY